MNEMNDKQRKLAEDNLQLVHFTISRYYPTLLSDSDIVSVGYMGLCRATLRWEESKGKFTTYAICAIRNAIKRELQNRKKRIDCISLNAPISDCMDDGEIITGEEVVAGDELDVTELLTEEFLKNLDDDERLIYTLRAKGYKRNDILRVTGYNICEFYQILKSIKRKYYVKMK